MPELPEVETCRRALARHLEGREIQALCLRTDKLRWPLDRTLVEKLKGFKILKIRRRAKYLLFELSEGTLLIHLGMSGSLRLVDHALPPGRHDHIDLVLEDGQALRLTDPRKFGAFLWTEEAVTEHHLLLGLGPEPLAKDFSAAYLLACCADRRQAIKSLIMDQKYVVGVGNIYATEALHRAGIRPDRQARLISRAEAARLVLEIRQVLREAIKVGGTTLQDFVQHDGRPGYFKQELKMYGRNGCPCYVCGSLVEMKKIGGRASCFCPVCQK